MAGNLPPPTPPTSGSSWKASDVLYVLGSAFGFIGGSSFFISTLPRTTGALAAISPFFFWAASYASNKGD